MEPNEGDGLDAWGVFLLGRIGKISRPSERDTFLAGFKAGRAKPSSPAIVNEGERQKFEAWAAVIASDSNTFVRDRHGCYLDPEIEWAWQGYKLGRAEQPSQTRAALSSTEECSEIEARTGLKRADTESRLAEEYSFLRWVNEAEALKIIWQALVDSELKRDAAAVPVEDRPAPTHELESENEPRTRHIEPGPSFGLPRKGFTKVGAPEKE